MPKQPAHYRAMDDRDLVIAFKAGEPGAYDEMYRRYSGRVRAVCRRMLANADDAQEAVQETFLKAYVALPQFNGNYRLGAWLGRIASNACLDALRARARVAPIVTLHPESDALGVETSAEDVVVGRELADEIGQIQPLHARALVMRGVEGLSHREIAGQLSMTPAQVKALLHRARRSFKRTWKEAQGLALAPLLWFKGMSRQVRGASTTGGQLAGAAAGASPLLAERVAASAVMVAVALTGLPGTSASPSTGAVEAYTRPSLNAIERSLPTAKARLSGVHSVAARTPAPSRRAGSAHEATAVPSEQSLVAGLDKMLTKTHNVERRRHEDRKPGKQGPVASVETTVQSTVKKAGKSVGDVLPPR
jgi:RNA polymerase sigma-70 factor, ECF subfamily